MFVRCDLLRLSHFYTQDHFFFFNDTATTEIYTLSLHDALPIWAHEQVEAERGGGGGGAGGADRPRPCAARVLRDRKSTRLNSSHANISYAVFFLKKNALHLDDY